MCGRYALASPDLPLIASALGHLLRHPLSRLRPRYNIAPSTAVPAIRVSTEEPGRSPVAELVELVWGLLPFWSKTPKPGYSTINARVETVDTKPLYREAFRHRRCLIPASGWYEWSGRPGRKQPWWIHPAEGGEIAFAGLWERWHDAERRIESCSIIVGDSATVADPAVRAVHDRAPLILRPEDYEEWLDPSPRPVEALKALLRVKPPALRCHPVSRRVNRAGEGDDDPALLLPQPLDEDPE